MLATIESQQPRANKAGSGTMITDVAYYVANKEGQQTRMNKAGGGTMMSDMV